MRALASIALAVLVGGVELGVHYGIPTFPAAAVGACLPFGTLRTSTIAVSCETPHYSEVFGEVVLDNGLAYPGHDALFDLASTRCTALVTSYVGPTRDLSPFTVAMFLPSADLWSRGARTITCIIRNSDGSPLTHSVRAAD